MIRQYISLSELVPITIKCVKEAVSKIPQYYVDDHYRALTNDIRDDSTVSIYIPPYAECNSEYRSIRLRRQTRLQRYRENGHENNDNAPLLPEYKIPHILELEYIQNHMELSNDELDMLYKTSVLLLLQALSDFEWHDIELPSNINIALNEKIFDRMTLYAIDIENDPDMIDKTMNQIHSEYHFDAHTANSLHGTGIAQSTLDIHNIFSKLMFDNDGAMLKSNVRKCLRYAPLYTTFALIEQRKPIQMTYADFCEYRHIYDTCFKKLNDSEIGADMLFSYGKIPYMSSMSRADVAFLSKIMNMAIDTMQKKLTNAVIPSYSLSEPISQKVLKTSNVSVLLTYPTLDW